MERGLAALVLLVLIVTALFKMYHFIMPHNAVEEAVTPTATSTVAYQDPGGRFALMYLREMSVSTHPPR